MIINASEKFNIKRAMNGDKEALCTVVDLFATKEEWVKSAEFLELLVDTAPQTCEKMFLEITGDELFYEDMLLLIGWSYFNDVGNYFRAYRWFQKYFDYMNYKYRDLEFSEREKLKHQCSMYEFMMNNKLLNSIEYRFLLQWEHDLYYNKG